MDFDAADLAVTDRLLTTTRSVRRRLDLEREVPREVVMECISLAMQAPTASNLQTWRFVVVTDPGKKAELGEIYRKTYAAADAPLQYVEANRTRYEQIDAHQMTAVLSSARHLVDVIERVPMIVIPCVEGRLPDPIPRALAASLYGSIFPAIWSLQLALRARGLGSSVTTSHLWHEDEVARVLDLPADIEQAALMPVAYYTGDTFRPAERLPTELFVHWDTWDHDRQMPEVPADVAAERVDTARVEMGKLFTPPSS
ncbi:MAG TPA: nitroreductase family protein [Ilumatobacteraceae bacterium]